jgi:hypothetical protein
MQFGRGIKRRVASAFRNGLIEDIHAKKQGELKTKVGQSRDLPT